MNIPNLTKKEIKEIRKEFKERYIPAISGPGINIGVNSYTMDKLLQYISNLKLRWKMK